MATLPQLSLGFNKEVKLSNDEGSLSSDTGMFLFREFDEIFNFSSTLAKHLKFKVDRLYYSDSNKNLLRQKIYQMIARYAEYYLTNAPVYTQIIGPDALASQPCLSRLYYRFDSSSIDQFNNTNLEIMDKVH